MIPAVITANDASGKVDTVIENVDVDYDSLKKLQDKFIALIGTADTDHDTLGKLQTRLAEEIAALVNSSPATLDTLNEIATALGDDPNFATTITNLIGTKVAKALTIAGIDLQDNITAVELLIALSLNNVTNTSDMNKPVSTAQATAIAQAITDLKGGVPVDFDTLKKIK